METAMPPKNLPPGPPTLIATMRYADAQKAIDWLDRAFGFQTQFVVPGEAGTIMHSQLTLGNAMVMVSTGPGPAKRPTGFETSGFSLYIVVQDPDALHDRAKAAGAEISMSLRDTDYGSRDFSCIDPEGYVWNFGTYQPWTDEA
jgi:uncharacterized glyoxalase superfamily protein PhnB